MLDQIIIDHGAELLRWARHSRRRTKWRKAAAYNNAQYEERMAWVKEKELEILIELAKPKSERKSIKLLRKQLRCRESWAEDYPEDTQLMLMQEEMELRRKKRLQKALEKVQIKANMSTYKKLETFLNQQRERLQVGEVPLGGAKVQRLLELKERFEEEQAANANHWPPEDTEDESD